MRELIFNTGGRKLFNEDLGDLQDQIRAAESLFLGEEPFVISGMIFTGSTGAYNISEGYVWLGNKIRKVDEITSFDEISTTTHLLSNNIDEETEYDDNTDKQSTISYGYTSVENLNTSAIPSSEFLKIDNIPNIRRYFENVLGDKYVLKDSGQTQVISNPISLSGAALGSNANISTIAKVTAAAIDVTNGDLQIINGNLSVGSGSIFALNGIVGDEFYTINGGDASILSDGTIGADKVVESSILDDSITQRKILDDAVRSGQIQNGSVITDKILDENVTYNKLSTDAKDSFVQVAELDVDESYDRIRTIVRKIGGLSMTGGAFTTVELPNVDAGITRKIVSVSVMILPDSGNEAYPFSQYTSTSSVSNALAQYQLDGTVYVDQLVGGAVGVKIEVSSNSRFNTAAFTSATVNRGYVTVMYMD